ncbi:hypothetical protein B0H14DRAFT_3462061 [Mycena olivaceomarginata]|nr:hypothetical protein B0H14DRAFT_3462061 [Mycena olivaceomarginata]
MTAAMIALTKAAPRVNWLELVANGIRLAEPAWEVAWAPQADKNKRMWLRISDVFARDENQKVIDALRKHFDDAGRPAVDGYNFPESIVLVRQNFASAFLVSRHVDGTAEMNHLF